MTRSEEIIWLAGLLDGEACFSAHQHGSWRPSLRVALKMADKDVLERAISIIGITKKPKSCAEATEKTKKLWRVTWCGADAEKIMLMVLPHMGLRRRAKIQQLLSIPNLSHLGPRNKKQEELAWLSGVLEAEGCFFVRQDKRPGRNPGIAVQLEMTDFDVVERASKVFDHTPIIYSSDRPNRQKSWRIWWIGSNGEAVMKAVQPFMCQRRTKKIKECLNTPNLSHRKGLK